MDRNRPPTQLRLAWTVLVCLTLSSNVTAVDFEAEVAPVLVARCVECHTSPKPAGGLDLTSRARTLRGGDSGVVVDFDHPNDSLLLQRVTGGEMPPESRGQSQRLPEAEIETLQQWIADGAPWPEGRELSLYESTSSVRAGLDWWSLQAVRRPDVPKVAEATPTVHPVDAFVRARLSRRDMAPAPRADRKTLVRRAYFDLHGLPPTPEQVRSFVKDDSPDAWEDLVDRLLASPRYGERWARYWLDLVRFAETSGYERDQLKPNLWKYRDWVIKALNDDLPYDRFVTDQLAGDEVAYRDEASVIATGMLRGGTWNDEPNDAADYLYTRLEDLVHTTATAFLGYTVKCARCHDHKFDPIPQTDYYRIAAAFWPGYLGQANLGGPSPEQLGFDVFGWTDRAATADPIHVLIKGERHRPGEVVAPGVLSAIKTLDQPFDPPPEGSKTTRRRLQLASWITDPDHPLTARVLVNRLWLHHFGQGIVRTPNNFGFKGDPPTHPDLLDWLASELVEGGWKIKRLHKLIMLSETYQQASQHPLGDRYAEIDSQNQLWWRFNRRRLDAEAARDSLLAASGRLNKKMGGPSFYPRMSDEALEGLSKKSTAWQTSPVEERSRRSIYMMTKRSRLLPLMTTLNFGDTTLPCGQRDVTTVAPQALALLNNHFVHAQSDAMARRVQGEVGDAPALQITRAWRLAFGRGPEDDEMAAALEHLERQRDHLLGTSTAVVETGVPTDGLAMWLRADRGVETDRHGKVAFWRDQSPAGNILPHDASQANPDQRPWFVREDKVSRPVIRFDGDHRQFLHLAGQLISSPRFTIVAIASDQSGKAGAREIVSNWNRRGRSTTSVFLGMIGAGGIRFSDAFAPAGALSEPQQLFVLTAVNDESEARTYQNGRRLASATQLANRDLHAPYVIGTQGNYNAEWWHGDIAEILVYDRALDESELHLLWQELSRRYGLTLNRPTDDPAHLALASLCHVLLNTNEFMFVD